MDFFDFGVDGDVVVKMFSFSLLLLLLLLSSLLLLLLSLLICSVGVVFVVFLNINEGDFAKVMNCKSEAYRNTIDRKKW